MITAGIDAGAATTKVVLLRGSEIAGYRIENTRYDFLTVAEAAFRDLLSDSQIGRDEVRGVWATGYGRGSITFAERTVSEITAHARGVNLLYPGVRGIIDVGGQDSKIIVLEDGRVTDFLMNDRCAAGTGKFLEYTARSLEVPVELLGTLALASTRPARITSMCTVFAESEVISLRARGATREDIAAGLIGSIAERIVSMAKRMGLSGRIAFVGGVAKNAAMRKAIEKGLGVTLFVPPEPQITGALGAALAARGAGERGDPTG
ncbi:MAG TPA: acyl-CoA dehydratase activase [Methanomicrobiales archaeon]|nr:acyl-CoA dehydratase activase [Methanomicrobiales archaeon]